MVSSLVAVYRPQWRCTYERARYWRTIAVAGVMQLFWKDALPSWVTGMAGLWLLASVVIFGVTGAALWNLAISAVAAILLAGWDGLEVEQMQHRHSHA